MSTVDIEVGDALSGKFTAVLVDESGIPPKDVVRSTDAFRIDCTWHIDGGLASSLGGTWYVQAAFEAIGPGSEFRSEEIAVALDGRTGDTTPYTCTMKFPAGPTFPDGTLKVPDKSRNEPYRVTVLLAYTDVGDKPGPLAAKATLGDLMIYA